MTLKIYSNSYQCVHRIYMVIINQLILTILIQGYSQILSKFCLTVTNWLNREQSFTYISIEIQQYTIQYNSISVCNIQPIQTETGNICFVKNPLLIFSIMFYMFVIFWTKNNFDIFLLCNISFLQNIDRSCDILHPIKNQYLH